MEIPPGTTNLFQLKEGEIYEVDYDNLKYLSMHKNAIVYPNTQNAISLLNRHFVLKGGVEAFKTNILLQTSPKKDSIIKQEIEVKFKEEFF